MFCLFTFTAKSHTILFILLCITASVHAQSKIETNFENPFSRLNNKEAWDSFKKKGAGHLRSEYRAKVRDLPAGQVTDALDIDLPADSLQQLLDRAKQKGDLRFVDRLPDTLQLPDSLQLHDSLLTDTLHLHHPAIGRLDSLAGQYPLDSAAIDSLLALQAVDSSLYTFKVDTARLISSLHSDLDTIKLREQPEHELLAHFRKESFLDAYKDHFADYEPIVRESQQVIEKYKKKEDFKSFVKEFFSNKLSGDDSLDAFRRFEPGTFFEVRQRPVLLVCNPSVKLNVTDKLSLGLGYSLGLRFDPLGVGEVYFRSFTQYRFRKYFAHFEGQSEKPVNPAGESFKIIPARYDYSLGVGRVFRINKLGGSLLLLYHFNQPASRSFSLRYGINLF